MYVSMMRQISLRTEGPTDGRTSRFQELDEDLPKNVIEDSTSGNTQEKLKFTQIYVYVNDQTIIIKNEA